MLDRMFVNKYINNTELKLYQETKIKTHLNNKRKFYQWLLSWKIRKNNLYFGEDYLYNGGLSVRTSLNTETQDIADKSLKTGLLSYDKRHGYRGQLAIIITNDGT